MDLLKLLSDVSTGVVNSIILDEEVEKIAKERLETCKNCEYNSTPGKIVNATRCKACGCFLKLKSRVMSTECGIASLNQKGRMDNPDWVDIDLKWFAQLDPKAEEQLNELI